jgi:hypothetical protein
MRPLPTIAGAGCVLLAIIYAGTSVWYSRVSRRELAKNRKAAAEATIQCPPGTSAEIARWSKLGYTHACYDTRIRHGPWTAWDNGALAISGTFSRGQRHGHWRWLAADGTVKRLITYDSGVVIHDSLAVNPTSR